MVRRMIVTGAVVAGLALPAVAGAKVVTYAGTGDGGENVGLDVRVNKKGKPKKVLEARGTDLNLQCEQSGELSGYTRFPQEIKVNRKGKFSASYAQPTYGNVSSIEGRFKPKKIVKGEFVFDYHFPADDTYPEEDCTSGTVTYEAERGAEDATTPFPPPEAR